MDLLIFLPLIPGNLFTILKRRQLSCKMSIYLQYSRAGFRMVGNTGRYLRYRWVLVPAGIKGDIVQTANVDRRRPSATQLASLCTYVSVWLMQVSGHVGLIGLHQHCHQPRIRLLIDRRRNAVPAGICDNKYRYRQKKVLPAHPYSRVGNCLVKWQFIRNTQE